MQEDSLTKYKCHSQFGTLAQVMAKEMPLDTVHVCQIKEGEMRRTHLRSLQRP